MTSFDTLVKRIDTTFLNVNKAIKLHIASPHLEWCIGGFSHTYYSSYQYIDSFGSGLLQRSSNYLLGSVITLIRDRFISSVLETIRSRYYQPLTRLSYNIPDRDLNLFLATLDDLLYSYWHQLRSWSFSELFSFLNQACVHLNEYLELPTDLYKTVKEDHHNRCFAMYKLIRDEQKEPLSLQALCYLAIRANWLDSYLDQQRIDDFLITFPDELNDILDQASWLDEFMLNNPYIDYHSLLYPIKGAPKHILYELDNHGELLFDLLLIEHCLKRNHKITISSKHAPILNDVTYSDLNTVLASAEFEHLKPYLSSQHLSIIDNGSTDVIPLRYSMSDAYIHAYQQADLVIMKGQGNFESFPLKRNFPLYKQSIAYRNDHIYLFGLKSTFSQRSFSLLKKQVPLETLICHATMIFN